MKNAAHNSPVIEALMSYPNIYMRNVHLWSYATGTPFVYWLMRGDLFDSKYLISHTSDLLRYLSMYKFGGIYMDLDVVVQKSFENVEPNFTGAESSKEIAAGVMSFSHTGIGHKVAELCVRYVASPRRVCSPNQNFQLIVCWNISISGTSLTISKEIHGSIMDPESSHESCIKFVKRKIPPKCRVIDAEVSECTSLVNFTRYHGKIGTTISIENRQNQHWMWPKIRWPFTYGINWVQMKKWRSAVTLPMAS